MAEKPKTTFTTGEIAQYCGVNFRTVIRWIERGLLKSYKLPGRGDNRIELDDFILFLQHNDMPIPEEFQSTQKKELKRILVVDDEKLLAKAIAHVLRRAGYEVEIASNGFEAGSMLNSFQPTLITLDLQMPGMDGFEVLSFLQQQNQSPAPKVLVISGLPQTELNKAKDAGADGVMVKPFENDKLLEKVKGLIGS